MWEKLKAYLHDYIPPHIVDPFGLARRMLRSKNPAARYALYIAVLGLVLAPLDVVLQLFERKFYTSARPSRRPTLFICGPARSGTTLVYQALTQSLPVNYINNLAVLFPRSPIIANRLFGKYLQTGSSDFNNYYSKTSGLAGPNDGNPIWNRWTGLDRINVHTFLLPNKLDAMRRFFDAFETASDKAVVYKFNNLNAFAAEMAMHFPNAYFICMTRTPEYLAQSLLITRKEIQGDVTVGYGVTDPEKANANNDYIVDICEQVIFLEKKALEQQRLIGPERFWMVPYEEFCADPNRLVKEVAGKILKLPSDRQAELSTIAPFENNNRLRVAPELFGKIEQTLASLKRSAQ